MHVHMLIGDEGRELYRKWIESHPQESLWQSLEWKHFQEALGRETRIYVGNRRGGDPIRASALVSIDRTAGGYCTWDIGRGPLWDTTFDIDDAYNFFTWIDGDARMDRCLQIFCSPKIWEVNYSPSFGLGPASKRHVYPEATRMIDLSKTEEEILAQMHPKGRYNIALAQKHGIQVTKCFARDIDAFYTLLQGTGSRDGFKIHQKSHYERFLSDLESSFILMARHEGKAIAGVMGVIWNGTGIYYYGASSYEHRHLMAPYLLQWEAMLHCKKAGCARYDLLGIAPEGSAKDNPWAGITDFKRKFGGEVVSYPPEEMIVLRPMMKMMLEWKRRMVG